MTKQQCIEWVMNNIPIMVKSKYPFTSQYAFDSIIQCLGERLYQDFYKPDNWHRGELQEPLVLLTPTERVVMPKGCTVEVRSDDEWLHNTTAESIDQAAKKMMTEKEKVKQLGEELGYGNVMQLASELWEEDMIAHGYPTSGVFVPALKSDIKSKT